MERKMMSASVKDADQGLWQAVFATFNAVDKDGDVTLPGAFEDGAPVVISAYGHTSWGGALPIGKGTIRTTDTEAILDGQIFLQTTAGRETFEVLKGLGELQQLSYGYEVADAHPGEFAGQRVRFLKGLKVHEVSPVLVGVGVDTRTLAVKGKDLTYDDQAEQLALASQAFIERSKAEPPWRAKESRVLSAASLERLGRIEESLALAAEAIRDLRASAAREVDDDKTARHPAQSAWLRFFADQTVRSAT